MNAKQAYVSAALAAIALLPAPASSDVVPDADWPMYQFKSDHNAVFDAPAWNVAWRTKLGGKINGGLSIIGKTLYVESFDRKLYALDALTGTARWDAALTNIAMNAPVVAGGLVFAGTGNNSAVKDHGQVAYLGVPGGDFIDAFDARTGVLRWRYNTAGEDMPTGAAMLVGNRAAFLFSNGDGHLRALDASTGSLLWATRFLGGASMSSLASFGDMVIGSSTANPQFLVQAATSDDRTLVKFQNWTWAVRADTGQFVWTSPYGTTDCSPTAADGKVFVEGVDTHVTAAQARAGAFADAKLPYQALVFALDARTGAKLWEYRSPNLGPSHPAGSYEFSIAGMYASGTFYDSLNFSQEFAAFDARTGRIRWKIATEGAIKMSAVERNGVIYVGDTAGYLYAIGAKSGAILAKLKFPGIFATSPPVIVGTTLFVANGDTVYALRLDDVLHGVAPEGESNF